MCWRLRWRTSLPRAGQSSSASWASWSSPSGDFWNGQLLSKLARRAKHEIGSEPKTGKGQNNCARKVSQTQRQWRCHVCCIFFISFIEGCSLRQKEQPSMEGSSYVVQSVPIHNSQPACWSGINLSKQWWHTVCAVLTKIVSLQVSCTEITNKFPIVENCI